MTCREALHLSTKSFLNKFFVYNFHYIYFPKTIPRKITVKYNIYVAVSYINTAVIIAGHYYSKRTSVFRISFECKCVIWLSWQEKLFFPCKGQFNNSGNFTMGQGKFNSFKEVRGGGWNLTIMNSFFFSTFVLFRNIKNSLVHTYLQKLDIRRLTFRVNVVLNKTVLDSSELTQQKRGRQNACVCQTWQAYYLRVCCDVQLI